MPYEVAGCSPVNFIVCKSFLLSFIHLFIHSFTHHVVRLMTDPYPFPKQAIHAARYNSSPFKFPYLPQRHPLATLTLILLTWRIRWAPRNASKWQMGFNLAFKMLTLSSSSLIYPCIQWVLGVSRPWREVNYSPPSNAEVENEWSYASIPLYASLEWTVTTLPFCNLYSLYTPLRVKDQFSHPCKIMKRSTKFSVIFHFLG